MDVLSGGRAIAGVGAGWMTSEWEAAGLSPAGRGRRLDEAIGLCRRLWSEETVAADGEFYRFAPVGFAPKPPQRGDLPILVGGESEAAMRRAIDLGDGWIAMDHDLDEARVIIERFRTLEVDAGVEPGTMPITMGAAITTPDDIPAWEALGLDRAIVAPWARTREAEAALRLLAEGWA